MKYGLRGCVWASTLLTAWLAGVSASLDLAAVGCSPADPTLHTDTVLKGGKTAGKYSIIKDATDMTACVRACCGSVKCHVALVHGQQCVNVECGGGGGCDLVGGRGLVGGQASSVVMVRSPGDAEWIATPKDNKTHEEANTKAVTQPKDRRCEYGLHECPANEECVPFSERQRNGLCQCVSGHHRNTQDECVKDETSTESVASGGGVTQEVPGPSTAPVGSSNTPRPNTAHASTPQASTPRPSTAQPSPASTTQKAVEKLFVSVTNKTVHLAAGSTVYDEEVTLSAYAIGGSDTAAFKYEWQLLEQPPSTNPGSLSDSKSQTITLSHLSQGVYVFRVVVDAPGAHGEAVGNLTVRPAKHINQPPKAVINAPSSITLPNSGPIIDGSGSTDDAGIESYRWEMVKAPLGYSLGEQTGQTLQLKDLIPGNYTIMLRVKDKEGLEGNATATMSVFKETDYPPTANAGGDQILYLPKTEITLYGNASTDDHGIEEWEWTKGPKDSGKAVDMQDTRTPYLHLSNLEEGYYQFVLRVQDGAGQSSEASVSVYVRKPDLSSPKANAGPDQQIVLPTTSVVLDASQSSDTSLTTHYLWTQKSGPNSAHLAKADGVKVNASGLTKGKYEFVLTTWNGDDNTKNTTDSLLLEVIQEQNVPPKANAGGDFSVTLPVSVVMVDGSKSSDDVGVTKWLWEREPTSLAAAKIINGSNHSPLLMFSDVVAGDYIWRLTVWDDQGASNSDTVSIIVKNGPHQLDEVEVVVGGDISGLSYSQLTTLLQKLQLFLHTPDRSITIKLLSLEGLPYSGQVRLTFLAYAGEEVVRGPKVVSALRHQVLTESADLLDLPLLSVDTVVCQNDCSGHGECIQATRECRCHTWWMESFIRRHLGDAIQNCDWSVVYVFVTACSVVVASGLVVWGVITLLVRRFGRNAKPRVRKPPRYTLLDGHEEAIKLKSSRVGGALLDSGSESDSDAEILFDSRKSKHKLDKQRNGYHKLARIRT